MLLWSPANAQAPIVVSNPPIPTGIEAKVISCESEGRFDAVGDHGLAYGIAQFHESTFNRMKALSGFYWLNYKNALDQEVLLKWALENGFGREWTCYRNLLSRP